MDGVSRAAGIGPTLELGGRKLAVEGRILQFYGEIEAEILRRLPDPLELIQPTLLKMQNADDRRALVAQAFETAKAWRFVSQAEIKKFLGTFGGKVFGLWLSIRHNDPATVTLEWVTHELLLKIQEEARQEIERKRRAREKVDEKKEEDAASDRVLQGVEAAIDQASGDDTRGN